MIPFNRPALVGGESENIAEALRGAHLSGDGPFSKKCEAWLETYLAARAVLLTPSCTHALEMTALLLDIGAGDEVIVPSYTFVSTANAFALRGARIVFVDICEDTLWLDIKSVERAITDKTRAIVAVHYAGACGDIERLCLLAAERGIPVIEDAAQALGSSYRGKPLGAFGAMSTFSFHETKNVTSGGEGGALVINDESLIARAEVVREKGTNRSKFFRGAVDKYTWVDIGSSYLPSELQAAFLLAQLESLEIINGRRLEIWAKYFDRLSQTQTDQIKVMPPPENGCRHNGHMFYILTASMAKRSLLIEELKARGVMAVFHYVPLHSSPAGKAYGELRGDATVTDSISGRLLRLPLWYGMTDEEASHVLSSAIDALECIEV